MAETKLAVSEHTKELKSSQSEKQDEFSAHAQQIDEGVYLGSEDAALVPESTLRSHKIGAILLVGFGLRPKYASSDQLQYHHVKAIDLPVFNLLQYVPESVEFIQESRTAGKHVLIHCQRGKSRSAGIAVAYLMAAHKLSFAEAHYRVRKARPEISINPAFKEQLELFEQMKFSLEGDSAAHVKYRTTLAAKSGFAFDKSSSTSSASAQSSLSSVISAVASVSSS